MGLTWVEYRMAPLLAGLNIVLIWSSCQSFHTRLAFSDCGRYFAIQALAWEEGCRSTGTGFTQKRESARGVGSPVLEVGAVEPLSYSGTEPSLLVVAK